MEDTDLEENASVGSNFPIFDNCRRVLRASVETNPLGLHESDSPTLRVVVHALMVGASMRQSRFGIGEQQVVALTYRAKR